MGANEGEGWARVASLVRARRDELGMSRDDVASRVRGISRDTIADLEGMKRDTFQSRTLSALCRALGWTSDSIIRILAGGDPIAVEDETPGVELALRRIDEIQEQVERLSAEVAELGRLAREPRPRREAL